MLSNVRGLPTENIRAHFTKPTGASSLLSPSVVRQMAEIVMCEPWELFNLLNQQRNSVSRLAQSNYLCLFGEQGDNRTGSHSQPRCSGDATVCILPPLSRYRCSRDTQLQNESHHNCEEHQAGGSVLGRQLESRDQLRRQIKRDDRI